MYHMACKSNVSIGTDSALTWSWKGHTFMHAFDIEPRRDESGLVKPFQQWLTHKKALAGEKPHNHGAGPFCDFEIPNDAPNKPGVYVHKIGDDVMYVGSSGTTRTGNPRGLLSRLREYRRIYARQSFKGGPRTTCHINSQIYAHTAADHNICVYVHVTSDFENLENAMIHDLGHPPWNLAPCKICRHTNGF